jgi:tetratricopeptide (TPR) repeat protein
MVQPAAAPMGAPQLTPMTVDWRGSSAGELPAGATVNERTRQPTENVTPQVPGYEILGVLGRGGMGVVYLARHLALDRQVALKMILSGAHASPHDLARFQAEAEAVAKFTHPNIVQVFEVGVHEGLPYCALELVTGGSLEEHLHGQPQSPREAAALLIPIAQAVQAAHDKGIVHRDLKPANVLLQIDNCRSPSETERPAFQSSILNLQSAIPKLTDFGLAKRLADDSGHTRTGEIVGTPSYMAPEQASGQVREVGPAADIYALGALLYQLLTGRAPFLGLNAMDTVLQVLTTDVVLPRRLQPTLPPDLETICLKCLRKEPAQRYASAADLATDLQNFLDGKPILARPAGRWERAVKWCRRYPAVAALIAVVTLAAVGMGALAAWAWSAEQEARLERDQKEAQRRQAETERQKAVEKEELANAVSYFLRFEVLGMADPKQQEKLAPGQKYDAEIKLRDVVVRASKAIDGRFPKQPLVEVQVRAILGDTLAHMGRPDLAVGQYERIRTLYIQQSGLDHPNTLRSMNSLANTYSILGRHADALKLREESLPLLKAKLGPDDPETLAVTGNLAANYIALGRYTDALKLREENLPLLKAKLGPDHPSTLTNMHNLALCYSVVGRLPEAVKLYEETLALRQAKLGRDHPETLSSMSNLAVCYRSMGRHPDALKLHEETLTLRKAKLGPDHPDTLGSMNNLALSYSDRGRLADALKLYKEASAAHAQRAARDPSDLDNLTSWGGVQCNWGDALRRQAKFAQSLTAYDQAIEHLQAVLRQQPRAAKAQLFLRAAYFSRAMANEPLHRYTEADVDWAKALEWSTDQQKAMIMRARDQWKAKRPAPEGSKP